MHGDLLRGASGDPQRHGGVVDAVLQAGCLVAGTQSAPQSPGRAGPFPPGPVKMWLPGRYPAAKCLQFTDDEARQPDGSPAGTRLGRSGELALDLGDDLGHGDHPGQQIDPAWA